MSEARDMPCAEVRQRMVAFVDGEIAGEESWIIRRHLDECPPCGQLAIVEQGFKRVLSDRLRRESAPEPLVERVRRALAQEPAPARRPAAPGWTGWRLGLAAASALAVVVVALWLGGLTGGARGPAESGGASGPVTANPEAVPRPEALALVPVHLRGTIVCAPCDRHRYPIEGQKLCEAYGHLNGVRDEQGRVWNLVEQQGEAPQADALLHDLRLRGRMVRVDGQAIEQLSYLIPTRAELL